MSESRTQYVNGRCTRQVGLCKIGDRIDLEGDYYADQDWNNPLFTYEFAEILDITTDSENFITLHTTQGDFTFPPTHYIDIDGEQ